MAIEVELKILDVVVWRGRSKLRWAWTMWRWRSTMAIG